MTTKAGIVVLAPNASEPPMDGGSLRSVAFRNEFQRLGLNPLWLGRERTDLAEFPQLVNSRSKKAAALRTLCFGSNYVRERSAVASWRAALRSAVKVAHPKTPVWCNYYWSYLEWIKAGGQGVAYIDTHNAEREWFENIGKRTANPLLKLVCAVSIAHAERSVHDLPETVTLVHVSEGDAAYYRHLAPRCRHVVVPNGCQVHPATSGPRRPGPLRLYFLGSLGVQMNQDALVNFANNYWPILRGKCEFTVFGSNPSPVVHQLCRRQGWPLHSNLPDQELDGLVGEQDVLALPFEYSAGSKLKLVDGLSRGKYALSTAMALREMNNLPATVLVGETGTDWARLLSGLALGGEDPAAQSRNFAAQFSWSRVISNFVVKESALHVKAGPLV